MGRLCRVIPTGVPPVAGHALTQGECHVRHLFDTVKWLNPQPARKDVGSHLVIIGPVRYKGRGLMAPGFYRGRIRGVTQVFEIR